MWGEGAIAAATQHREAMGGKEREHEVASQHKEQEEENSKIPV